MTQLLIRWFVDDSGQDLVEYILLGSFIGFAGLAALQGLDDIMNAVYASWDATTQEIWVPEDPQ